MKDLTIVISYYKALDNLKVIFKALNRQSCQRFEVILAEDDNNAETVSYIESVRPKLNFPMVHLSQEVDDGFRKISMLNLSISQAKTDKIVFIDGDCIPHKHFAKQYLQCIDRESFCIGRSVMLDQKTSETVKSSQSLLPLNFFKLIWSSSGKKKEGFYFPLFQVSFKTRGIVGRNWGCLKKALIEINGFDEDYNHAGAGEDSDIEWRLMAHGLRKKSVKNKAIVYHLYHKRWYATEQVEQNLNMMWQKIQAGQVRCLNGIMKETPSP